MTRPSRSNPDNKSFSAQVLEYLGAIALAVVLVVAFTTFVGRMYVIPSGSMEPTLYGCPGCSNDRIAVEHVSSYFTDPQPGDVVVYEGTESWNVGFEVHRPDNVFARGLYNFGSAIGLVPGADNTLVKRVIATEGQTVACQAGDAGVTVDGVVIDSSFVHNPPQMPVDTATGSEACGGEYFGPVTVPEDSLWVMGDNRTNSLDSRAHIGDQYQGTIPLENVRGKVLAVVWPLGRIGTVDHVDLLPGA